MRCSADVRVLVNQCDSDTIAADDAHDALSMACERFLVVAPWRHCQRCRGMASPAAPLQARVPRVWESPNSAFGHAMLWLGRAVCDVLAAGLR